jgi:predicted nucleic-acid-binding protein
VIAVDTNVLLRVLLDDDAPQARSARRLLTARAGSGQPAFINRIVLCEAVWTLVSGYRYSRPQVRAAIELLLAAPAVRLEDHAAVEEALTLYTLGRLGFADALVGVVNRRAGCTTTHTFDRRAAETVDFSAVDRV